jgi:hypothetical protein
VVRRAEKEKQLMTAQISDTVIFQRQNFAIAGINGSGLFDPNMHGIIPVTISTACWRGYYCSYEIADEKLYLRCLHIGLNTGEVKQDTGPKLFGKVSEYSKTEHCFVYDELNEQIPFTGGLLIGRDFIREMYVHMGYHPAYKFRVVYELIFDKGKMIEEANRSEQMAQYRERISGQPLKPTDLNNQDEIEDWINDCFNLDY